MGSFAIPFGAAGVVKGRVYAVGDGVRIPDVRQLSFRGAER